MKMHELVSAVILRAGSPNIRALTWAELGQVFDVTKDVARHSLNRFKNKYHIIDADLVDDSWAENFIESEFNDADNDELQVSFNFDEFPGDRIDGGHQIAIGDGLAVLITELDTVQILSTKAKPKAKTKPKRVRPSRSKKPKIQLSKVAASIESDEEYEDLEDAEPETVKDIEPLKFLMTPNVLVVIRDGQPLSIDKSHKNFAKIKESLETSAWQKALDLIDMKTTLTKYSNGRVTVENSVVKLDDERVSGKLSDRLITCLTEGNSESLDALASFMQKCDENPDFRVVSRIFDFIDHTSLRLDKDGFILTYKVVRNTYMDKHSNSMDNSPGTTVTMKRNKVNPKDEETCSTGLHVCARGYLKSFGNISGGDRVVLCKVHPKDFVSIPTDYNNMKARVCEYTVLKDITENFASEDEGLTV